ncbi:MAG: sialate O-acetylesterase [Roseburia sp.]|nr:sialate O-acetylesterase [Roseburia sp.]MCM1242366.1 sialate O-acetylesterase [Roseburia sp.]
MNELRLPRLISDGMVLQQKKKVRIWGEDEPGRKVTVSFLGMEYITDVDEAGEWEVFLKETEAAQALGAQYMSVQDDAGEKKIVEDILIGDVFICAGQSNMELPINRVMDRYPQEIGQCENTDIRTFKILECRNFHGPLKDHESGEWKSVSEETFPDFSATAYFFAKHMYQMSGVPIGLINASLGGSRIESWMGRDMLEGYDEFLKIADRYQDDAFVKERLAQNERQMNEWHRNLDSRDIGLMENWAQGDMDVSAWKEAQIPFFFKDTELKGFIGSVWFYKEFTAGAELAGKEASLWLGTIVDSDTVYVNGVLTGHTDYQYPPRKYTVPEGVLREGKNTIVIRVKSEIGQGRFTDGKLYALFREDEKIDMSGTWKYRIGASCEMIQATDFVSWKPTGLYHGMMAPSHKYAAAGILWYQGESNTHETAGDYLDLSKRMIAGYRAKWADELPFIYVQLPNFRVERYDADRDETFCDWPRVREAQRRTLQIPGTAMVTAIDLGEDNDLHPLNKEDIGYRLAMQAAKMLYGKKSGCDGPQIENVQTERYEQLAEGVQAAAGGQAGARGTIWKVTLSFREASGLRAISGQAGKSTKITDFEVADEKGDIHSAAAKIAGEQVILTCTDKMQAVTEVRYCYHNTNSGALLYNGEGFPMTPFCVEVDDRQG